MARDKIPSLKIVWNILGKSEKTSKNSEHYSELNYGQFSRSFNLPEDVKDDEIKASMKDGVLALSIPRMDKVAPDVKKISIK